MKDSELRFSQGKGTPICTFTMAVDRDFKVDGQPEADFIPCTLMGKVAESLAQYLTKGKQISATGAIQTWSFNKDGEKRYGWGMKIDRIKLLSKKSDGQAPGCGTPSGGFNPPMGFESNEPVDDGSDIPF